MPITTRPVLLALSALALLAAQASPQGGGAAERLYLSSAAKHFGVSESEVAILAEWGVSTEEIPVILYAAKRGGVSPDAVAAMRKGGTGWNAILRRFGAGAHTLHLVIENPAGTPLADLYARYASTPRESWPAIDLSDREVVALVNTRFLSEYARTSPDAVLRAHASAGGFVGALRILVGD